MDTDEILTLEETRKYLKFSESKLGIPTHKKEAIDLKTLKSKIKIEHSLNPLAEGKDYLPLI